MNDIYDGREQTLAKHCILEKYLEKLTFKLLGGGYRVLTYVDGFSGPWESETSDYSDTSFMIAIRILESVHKKFQNDGDRRQIRCFLVEKDPNSYQKLSDAVLPHNDPANGFYVRTYCGNFEDAIPEIRKFVGTSFALTFIDPTGWTGYSLKKIEPILRHEPSETIVNFMFDHVSRFVGSDDPAIVASFDPILGGPNWKERLDKNLAPGRAAEKLFKENLKSVGQFKHVLSTVIEKTAAKRPHFALAYGTRNPEGLKVFRDVEFQALRAHEGRRLEAKQSLIKERTGQGALFGATELPVAGSFEEVVADNRKAAKLWVEQQLGNLKAIEFSVLCEMVLASFVIRETDVKDICVDLANRGIIFAPWRNETPKKPKPSRHHIIELAKEKPLA